MIKLVCQGPRRARNTQGDKPTVIPIADSGAMTTADQNASPIEPIAGLRLCSTFVDLERSEAHDDGCREHHAARVDLDAPRRPNVEQHIVNSERSSSASQPKPASSTNAGVCY